MSQPEQSLSQRMVPAFPSIELPEQALPSFKRIVGIDERLFALLLAAISETQPTLTLGQFARNVAPKLPTIGESDLRAVLGTALNLFSMRQKLRVSLSVPQFVERIIASPLISTSDMSSDEKRLLSTRLTQLLSFEALGVTAKGFDVMTEHDHVFCSARILSDIRPVFAASPDKASGAVIIHNLQIGFHQDQRHQDFYVAMDTNDIKMLKLAIDRAEKKTIALKEMLRESRTPYLEV